MWQVHNEKWVSPYNGGAELAGCGGGEAAFAKKPAVELARVQVKACLTQALAQSIPPFSCRIRLRLCAWRDGRTQMSKE